MRHRVAGILWSVVLGLCPATTGWAWTADRSAAEILKELDDTRLPEFDNARSKDNPAYTRAFLSERKKTMEKRAALILELYKAAPDHGRIPTLMTERWDILAETQGGSGLRAEIDGILAETANPKLKVEAAFGRAGLEVADSFKTGVLRRQGHRQGHRAFARRSAGSQPAAGCGEECPGPVDREQVVQSRGPGVPEFRCGRDRPGD